MGTDSGGGSSIGAGTSTTGNVSSRNDDIVMLMGSFHLTWLPRPRELRLATLCRIQHMADGPRMTLATQAVLRALIENPAEERYGLELSATTGLPSGTLHPILARLEILEWVDSAWENIDPQKVGRPRRRYYRINERGWRWLAFPWPRPTPAGLKRWADCVLSGKRHERATAGVHPHSEPISGRTDRAECAPPADREPRSME